jgi:UrcA family protein
MNTATHLAPASCLKANFRSAALLTLCALTSASAVAGSQTGAAPVTRSAKVSLADLDLSTPDGARAARERLRETARRLCGQVADHLDLSHQANFVKCIDETMAKALRQVATPALVAGAAAARVAPAPHR